MRKKDKKKNVNKEFTRITYFFVTLFLVMMGYICYFTAVKGKTIINSPYNKRQDIYAKKVIRGSILDRNHQVLADTKVNEEGAEYREYPYGPIFSHVIGYDKYGKSGLEAEENFPLLTSNAFVLERMMNEFRNKKNVGDTVVTTLDANLQETAYRALGNAKGAVVVMEPDTGKLLAVVSKPDFDPNAIGENWKNWNQDEENAPLLNRAMQGQYPPGSTFKILTTLAFLEQDPNYANYSYDCPGYISHGGVQIHCFNGQAHGHENLDASFANSCNASFCNIGLHLNREEYRKEMEELLFNGKLPRVLPYAKSRFSIDKKSTDGEVMMTAMGQGKTLVSPYHMALITSAIANGGTLMEPYLVNEIVNKNGASVEKFTPKKYKTLMDLSVATQLKQYMASVVDHGTATLLRSNAYQAAGKTGTAEYSSDKTKSHSWFVGFANVDQPKIVVAVVVEESDISGVRAVPVAKRIFDAYFHQ